METGHGVSAREAYLRAFTYYRTATLCLHANDPRFRATWELIRSCFRRAAALLIGSGVLGYAVLRRR
ncbi:MAG: hypothetical protein M3305_14820 [Actinomycetota bacterium]|nr:hypothetical protein [Actinomycetota bacterium]